jgi:hypothetical protein
MDKLRCRPLAVGFISTVLLTPLAIGAQAPSADRAAALKQSLAANQAALRQYTWIETTTVSLKGEVKKQEQKQCSYGADGKVQKTPLPGAAPAAPARQSGGGRGGRGGRVKEAVVEHKVDELKDYMEKTVALVHQYVPPDPQRIQAAQSAGNVAVQPSGGTITTLTVKDYVKPGDALTIGFDTAAKKLAQYMVASYVEKPKDDDLTLDVMFASLPDGTSYPQQVTLDVKAKHVLVKVANSGYKKSGS